MRLRAVLATRYVTPLREGGSLPAIVEADDDGMYVLKFRGAGQGPKALIAELVAGEVARAAGLSVPEIVFVELDPELARTEPDPEIQALIRASGGINLALDYLPGAVTFDPVVDKVESDLASSIVWFDAYVSNVDRTPRNSNLLVWHRRVWLIDHGAALYFHHSWENAVHRRRDPFPQIKDHILLPFANSLPKAGATMLGWFNKDVIERAIRLIPDSWLADEPSMGGADRQREAYKKHLLERLEPPHAFLEEAVRARSLHV